MRSTAGPVRSPNRAPTSTTRSEVVASAERVATSEKQAAASVETTPTTVGAEEQTVTTITFDERSTEAKVTAQEVSSDRVDVPPDTSAADGLLWMRVTPIVQPGDQQITHLQVGRRLDGLGEID